MTTSELLIFCFVISLVTFALGYYISYEVGTICI